MKNALKWIQKTLKKILHKSTKNIKLSAFLAVSEALEIHPTYFLGHFCSSQFFLSLIFILVTRYLKV